MSKDQKNTQKTVRDERGNENIFTKETLGVVLILFATLSLVCLITRDSVFSLPGKMLNSFLFGLFGYFAYAVMLGLIVLGVTLVTGKPVKLSKPTKAFVTLSFITLAILLQVVSMRGYSALPYGEYLVKSYTLAEIGGITTCTASGLVVSLVSYGFSALLTNIGSYVVLGLLLALCVYAVVKTQLTEKQEKIPARQFRTSFVKTEQPEAPEVPGVESAGERDYPVEGVVPPMPQGKQKLFVVDADANDFKTKKKLGKDEVEVNVKVDFTQGGLGIANVPPTYVESYSQDMQSKIDYIKTPATIKLDKPLPYYNDGGTRVSNYIPNQKPSTPNETPTTEIIPNTEIISHTEIPLFEHEKEIKTEPTSENNAERFVGYANVPETEAVEVNEVEPEEVIRPVNTERIFVTPETDVQPQSVNPLEEYASREEVEEVRESVDQTIEPTPINDQPAPSILDKRRVRGLLGGESDEEPSQPLRAFENPQSNERPSERVDLSQASRRSRLTEIREEIPEEPTEPEEKEAPPINREYFRPPLDLLNNYEAPIDAPKENHEQKLQIIRETLSQFHIDVEPHGFIQGPSITRYELTMPAGISVKKVVGYDVDLSMRLESKYDVRIQAPIPGKNLIGVEVANKEKVTVGLREIMEKHALEGKEKPGALTFALGKDIVGNAVTDNLAKGPHYLVAGATGAGKSVCLNVMIISLIMRYSPEELKLFLVDPKGVEFSSYEHLPHLMIDEIITKPQKAIAMLKWAYEEMERRFMVFKTCGKPVVDINGYNSEVASDTVAKMPRLVIIIDELADLMQTCKRELEDRIRAIAQKARAVGIHLVLATQRPSVDIITGTIKANLPSRIAFRVTSFADSNTILGEGGADKLLGDGDMLYKNSTMPVYERYQGAFISAMEINNVVTYIKEKNVGYFDDELQKRLEEETNPKPEEPVSAPASENSGGDTLFLQALWFAINNGNVSISGLQRRFGLGFPKAGGLVDKMERQGFIAPSDGGKLRKITLTREDFIERFGDIFGDEAQ